MKKQIGKQAVRKIKSNSGASILIALLVFLIAAMTGSVILTSATVSNGAVHRSTEEYENMTLLKSAAKVVTDGLQLESDVNTSDKNTDGRTVYYDPSVLKSIQEVQTYMAQYVYDNGIKCNYDISMALNQNADSGDQKKIKGTLTMDLNYSVYVDLEVDGSNSVKGVPSHLYIRFNGDPLALNDGNTSDNNNILKVEQSDPIITTVQVKEADDE